MMADKNSTHQRRRRSAPQPGTRPQDTVGGDFERRLGRLEFAEGALARLRLKVPAPGGEPGRDVVTDIDVLSLDVDSRLRVTRSSLECKTTKGQQGEMYTLVWLAGFRQLMAFDHVVLARQTLSRSGRQLARRLGVGVMDERTLAKRELAHAWVPERFAHIDGEACFEAERRTDVQLRGLQEISPDVVSTLRGGALTASPHGLLTAVATLGSAVSRQGVLPEPAAAVLGGHALMGLVLAAVQDAGRMDLVPSEEMAGRLARALTLGDPDETHLVELLERVDALVDHVHRQTHRAYVEAGAQPIAVAMPSLRNLITRPPDFIPTYIDMVARFRDNPQISRQLPQTVELACFEAVLGGEAWREPAFAHLFTSEHHALLRVALACLEKVAGRQVHDAIAQVESLSFSGSDGRVPDRRTPSKAHLKSAQGELWSDTTNAEKAPE